MAELGAGVQEVPGLLQAEARDDFKSIVLEH